MANKKVNLNEAIKDKQPILFKVEKNSLVNEDVLLETGDIIAIYPKESKQEGVQTDPAPSSKTVTGDSAEDTAVDPDNAGEVIAHSGNDGAPMADEPEGDKIAEEEEKDDGDVEADDNSDKEDDDAKEESISEEENIDDTLPDELMDEMDKMLYDGEGEDEEIDDMAVVDEPMAEPEDDVVSDEIAEPTEDEIPEPTEDELYDTEPVVDNDVIYGDEIEDEDDDVYIEKFEKHLKRIGKMKQKK